VLQSKEEGKSSVETARRYKISKSYVDRVYQRFRESGERGILKRGGHRIARLKEHSLTLCQWLEKEPGLSVEQLCQRAREQLGVKIGTVGMWRHLGRIGLRFKKNDPRKRAVAS
jgi:transposase